MKNRTSPVDETTMQMIWRSINTGSLGDRLSALVLTIIVFFLLAYANLWSSTLEQFQKVEDE